jgi:hypothetical protein
MPLHHHFHTAGSSCNFLRSKTGGSLTEPSLNCKDGEPLPSQSFQFLPISGLQCMGVHYNVEEQYIFSLGISHKIHVSVSGGPEHKLYWQLPFCAEKSISMHPLAF